MWRINNILLAIVLAGVVITGGLNLIEEASWELDSRKNAAERDARILNAADATDNEGGKLRTQAVSFDRVIDHDNWGEWNIVPITQSALESPIDLSERRNSSNDTIVVTGSRLRRGYSSSSPVYTQFTNNLVLRNSAADTEEILFTRKTAVAYVLPLINPESPGVAVLFVDEDTNANGKLDKTDKRKIRVFRFNDSTRIDIGFHGIAPSFLPFAENDVTIQFTTTLDLDGDGEINENFEPAVLYESSVTTGETKQALSGEIVSELQSIIDDTASQ